MAEQKNGFAKREGKRAEGISSRVKMNHTCKRRHTNKSDRSWLRQVQALKETSLSEFRWEFLQSLQRQTLKRYDNSEVGLVKQEKYKGKNIAGNVQGNSFSYKYETGVEVRFQYPSSLYTPTYIKRVP